MVNKFLDKKGSVGAIKNEIMYNKELAEQLHKPIIRKFKKRKVHLQKERKVHLHFIFQSFIDNIWSTDLAGMQLVSKFDKGFRFLSCVIDIYSKYAWLFL